MTSPDRDGAGAAGRGGGSAGPGGGAATVVGPGPGERYGVAVLLAGLGAALGALLKPFAGWALSLPWVPLGGPLRLIDAVPPTPALIGGVVLGIVAGLLLAAVGDAEHLYVVVTRDELTLRRGEFEAMVPRTAVGAVFLDGTRMVVLGHRGQELCSRAGDLSAQRLATTLRSHGYPWRPDGDPQRAAYRLWVPELPDLPAGADALFATRQRALDRDDRAEAELLRAELSKLDVVVRDEQVAQVGQRQFWRRAGG